MCNQGCIPFSQSRLIGFPCKPERTSEKRLIANLILVWFSMEQKIEFWIAKSSVGITRAQAISARRSNQLCYENTHVWYGF